MSNLDIEFKKAIQRVRHAPKENPPLDEVRLNFYAYYKQAINGDVQDEAPSVFWFKARAKWNAWNRLRGITKDKAKEYYISLVNKFI